MTSVLLWPGCKVRFESSPEEPEATLPVRAHTEYVIFFHFWTHAFAQHHTCRVFRLHVEPFVSQPHTANIAANVVNAKCSVMLSVLNIFRTDLQPTLLSASLSVRHLGRRGLEALDGRLYGWRMNNLREVDRRDRSRLITSKASGLPKGTAATHRQWHKGPPQTKAWSRPKL